MFVVNPEPATTRWPDRPEMIVARRITGHADDHEVAYEAMRKVARSFGHPLWLAPAEGLRGSVVVRSSETTFTTDLVGASTQRINWYSAEDLPSPFFADSQFLVAAGLSKGTPRQENWNACLEFVRAMRPSRPAVYAQFLSWKFAPMLAA